MKKGITIIGDGAMGCLCAMILSQNRQAVRVWGRRAERIEELASKRENTAYLPGIKLPEEIIFTTDSAAALENCKLVICAVPAQHSRSVLENIRSHFSSQTPVISVAKGIENYTTLRPTQIIQELLGVRPVAAVSGPSIAMELARGLPATIVAASEDQALTKQIQNLFTTTYLRVYSNTDLLGVELAGAMKNVVAIAAGILDGIKAGTNAKASLLTRGLVEISRLGFAMGARAETFNGLAGLGDLVTTCFAPEGRNRSFGQLIGRGLTPTAAAAKTIGV
ncbi:MAG TPA: NAD(P)H-dependent glycerol-3-phosphate dehydrogenase, partial [Phycisphaerae bacterium]|nr:NAD(P)H-dependent glycerol-3-phosphate dehydrogenase [Phycisphaerae bacterium]